MKPCCARSACKEELDIHFYRIWNQPEKFPGYRDYCIPCGRKIIEPNQKFDDLKLAFRIMFPKFKYNSYWGTWNRCFGLDNGNNFIELNLTPVNGFRHGKIDEIRGEVFRAHGTYPDRKDIETDELPAEVVAEMKQFLGDELVEKLLNHDYLAEITVEDIIAAREKSNGGGVPLQAIKDIRDGKLQFHYNG